MNTIEPEPIPLQVGETLIQALVNAGYDNIPSNCILDKTLPGIGATYTEIHAFRNSIIIEPNVPVIKGKVKKHGERNILAIHEGVTALHVQKYLQNDSRNYQGYKKLITTPEGFWKIRKAAKAISLNIYTDYFCLFDECEKLTQDVNYRPRITNSVEDFFDFTSKALVSATPLPIQHPKIKEQNFKWLKFDPQFDYKKDIQVIITNDIANVIIEKLEALKYSQCICIFYKSIAGIDSIMHSLKMTKYNSKIFCSPKYVTELSRKDYNVQVDFAEPLLNYNFFTSRYFSAFDIDINVKPDIIIITDLKQAKFSLIDPFTEAIQIQGRFRKDLNIGKNYNSLTHISNYDQQLALQVKTDEELTIEITQYRRTYDQKQIELSLATDPIVKKAILTDLCKISYAELLNEDGSLNEFAVNNRYNIERVKRYYTSADSLPRAYEDTEFFKVNFTAPDLRFFLNELKLSTKKRERKKIKICRLYVILKQLNLDTIEQSRKLIIETFDDAHTILDAYLKLNSGFIPSVDYNLTKIKKALAIFLDNQKRFDPAIWFEITDMFQMNLPQDKNFYSLKLKDTYGRYLIEKKVTQETIRDYFEVKENNGSPATFTLTRIRPINIGVGPM